jgi:DinB superfamily
MRRTVAVFAVASTLSGGLPVTAAVTELERQRLVAHLNMTAGWLVDEVSGLATEQIEFRRAPDAWTIAEVVEHLVVVAPIYWQDLQTAVKQPPSDASSWTTDADMLWYGIDRTRREQAVPTERPTGQLHDLRAGLEALRAHHDRLREYVATTPVDLRAHLVQRQGCDAYQWALMISAHEQRHVLQIREIKADPKFPKK